MNLPDLSFMMKVGQLRYIQSVYETPDFRNPDTAVRDFLPALQRWRCDLRGATQIVRLRAQPFYYYVLARTKYYDAVFVDSICSGVRRILNIGCGSDTRAYRFGHLLQQKGIRVLECDQAEAIQAKAQIARRLWPVAHVDYLSIDLNDESWPDFERWLDRNNDGSTLVLMEGVSPYVNDDSFGRFLDLLGARLGSGSSVAYDFKLRGVAEGFGLSDRTQRPFRLPDAREEVVAYHAAHGYRVEHLELSSDLSLRLVPSLPANAGMSLFREDALVKLQLS
jgi:methyltransferase (TIGR00027 family)